MSPGDANDRKPSKKRAQTPVSTRPARGRAPAKKALLTPAAKAKFVELVGQGVSKPEAARRVHPDLTGTRFRALTREGSAAYDPEFTDALERAIDDRRREVGEQALAEMEHRQLGADPGLKSDRGLHNLAIWAHDGYRAAHRQTGATVNVTGGTEVTHLHVHVEAAAERIREQLAQVVDLDAARVASGARPALGA